MGPASLNKKIELPHQGKFNAAEKINFMVLVSTYPLYIVTGLLIWMPGVAIVAWFLHFGMAMAARTAFSGLLKEDEEEIVNHYSSLGFFKTELESMDEWIALLFKK